MRNLDNFAQKTISDSHSFKAICKRKLFYWQKNDMPPKKIRIDVSKFKYSKNASGDYW